MILEKLSFQEQLSKNRPSLVLDRHLFPATIDFLGIIDRGIGNATAVPPQQPQINTEQHKRQDQQKPFQTLPKFYERRPPIIQMTGVTMVKANRLNCQHFLATLGDGNLNNFHFSLSQTPGAICMAIEPFWFPPTSQTQITKESPMSMNPTRGERSMIHFRPVLPANFALS